MVSASSVVAHLVKLLVTTICMKHLTEPYRAKALPTTWSLRAFRILFMHSILGIFRFGKTNASHAFDPIVFMFTCCSFHEQVSLLSKCRGETNWFLFCFFNFILFLVYLLRLSWFWVILRIIVVDQIVCRYSFIPLLFHCCSFNSKFLKCFSLNSVMCQYLFSRGQPLSTSCVRQISRFQSQDFRFQ